MVVAIAVGAVWFTSLDPSGSMSNVELLPSGAAPRDPSWTSPLWLLLHSDVVPKMFAPLIGLAIFQISDGLYLTLTEREAGTSRLRAFFDTYAATRLVIPIIIAIMLFVLLAHTSPLSPQGESVLGFLVVLYTVALVVLLHLESALIDSIRFRASGQTWWQAFSNDYETSLVWRIFAVVIGTVAFFGLNATVPPIS
jgi:hypothetical protein